MMNSRLLLLGLAFALVMAACAPFPEPVTPAPTPTPTPAPSLEQLPGPFATSLARILSEPEEHFGRTVTVTGSVQRQIEPESVTIMSRPMLDLGETLVIGIPQDVVLRAEESDAPVEVTGSVREFDIRDVEQDTGRDLDDDVYAEFEGLPVILATRAEAQLLGAVWAVGEETIGGILETPSRYVGETVALSGEAAAVLGERAFELVGAGAASPVTGILVVTETTDVLDRPLDAGDLVQVEGELQLFQPASVEAELGVELEGEAYLNRVGDPVVVASSLRIVAETDVEKLHRQIALYPPNVTHEQTLRLLSRQPEQYYGRWTTVVGTISEMVGQEALLLEPTTLLGGDSLLVLNPFSGQMSPLVGLGSPVQAAGELQPFELQALEQVLDVDLEDAAFAPYEGEPVLLLETLRVLAPVDLGRVRSGALELIIRSPDAYAGERVRVTGVVEEVIEPGQAFAVDGPVPLLEDDLLVLLGPNADADAGVKEGELWLVVGSVRRFSLSDPGIDGVDLDPALYSVYEDRAAIIAESVEPAS